MSEAIIELQNRVQSLEEEVQRIKDSIEPKLDEILKELKSSTIRFGN